MELDTFELMARYNVWATNKLNQVLETVSEEDFNADCGLFFKSISGTLNHLLVGEHYFWYARFTSAPPPKLNLDSIVEPDQHALLKQLQDRAQNWIGFLQQVDTTLLKSDLQYKTAAGKAMSLPYAATLLHVFNHGTHHRGQVSTALTAMGYPCPEMDMVFMLREEQQAS